MEKSGKQGAFRARCRLLIPAFFALALSSPLAALEVDIFVSSYELSVGDTLRMEFSVHDAMPADTSVDLGSIPVAFIPGASSKERRFIDSGSLFGDKMSATVIAREWKLAEAGKYTLGPFAVSSKDDSVTLPPVYITVVARPVADFDGLRWIIPPSGFLTGKPVRIVLEAHFTGKAAFVSCPAPENALLEALPFRSGSLQGDDPSWSPVAVYNWTPLSPGLVPLPSAVLEITGTNGSVRRVSSLSLSVSVIRLSVSDSGSTSILPASGVLTPVTVKDTSVPVTPAGTGEIAGRLKELRNREYTSLFPGKYRTERKKLELELGLGSTLPVPHAAWKPFAVIGAIVLSLLALSVRLIRKKPVFFRNLSRFLLFLSMVLVFFSIYLYTRDLKTAGVVTGGDLRHIPEANATVVESLKEGAPVLVLRKTGDWVYAEASSSLRGWIPAANVLEYTITERSGGFRGYTERLGEGNGKAVRKKTPKK